MPKPKPYVNREYTRLQLIAWEHPTADITPPGDELKIDPTRPDDSGPNKPPIPIFPAKMPADEKIRLKRLLGVVELAYQKLAANNDDDGKTLKIFLAPEFTFRPNEDKSAKAQENGIGQRATYTREAMTELVTTMREMFSDAKYRDWLFVPGTIMWSERIVADVVQQVSDYVFFNTALMFKGGAKNAPLTVIHKHAASNSDNADVQKSADKNPLFKDILGTLEDRKHNVLDTDGIRFGLEVCIDHGAKLLKNAVMRDYFVNVQKEYPFVDVHLLVACDKLSEPTNLAIDEGGYFMRVDGSPAARRFPKQLTPGYGIIPRGPSGLFRRVTKDEVPAEYTQANDAKEAAKLLVEDEDENESVYVSHYDANGKSMIEPVWKEDLKQHGALETYGVGDQWLVAYPPQPFKSAKRVGPRVP